ncbi:MAG: hypothetical protein ABR599_11695 [Gemmatimonadota bacterium]
MLKFLAWITLAAVLGSPSAAAQSAGGATGLAFLPSDVSFVVRLDAAALAASPMLPRLLAQPQASNALARALARPATLRRMREVYVGFPSAFTPETTELPVVVLGSFSADDIVDDLASAPGVEVSREGGRAVLVADDALGTSYAAPLAEGVLAVGDRASVLRMLEGGSGERLAEVRGELGPPNPSRHIVGAGKVPVALRGWLQAEGGALAAPFATIDRVTFEGTLDEAVRLRATLHPTTAEGRQAIEQALGAARMFGPSRFADDPELLSAVQSLRFSSGPGRVDLSATVPRSLLLRFLEP